MAEQEIICSFQKKCKNFQKLCTKCRWNAIIDLKDHLLIEEGERTIRFL